MKVVNKKAFQWDAYRPFVGRMKHALRRGCVSQHALSRGCLAREVSAWGGVYPGGVCPGGAKGKNEDESLSVPKFQLNTML